MRGILYGVGVGPGDPELMTLKAVRLIKENDIIAVPGAEVRETVAYKIAVQAVPELADKELLPIYMPMTHDKAELELNHEKGAKALEAALDTGKNVVFLTLGDPTIYSTFSYVQKRVEEDGYETRLVSGITSFCATAARLNIPLTEWNQPLHVQPAVHRLDSELDQPGTYVLMKSGKKMNQVKEILAKSGRNIRMVENCGMPDEHIYNSVEEIPDDAGYYSLIIAKEKADEAKRSKDETAGTIASMQATYDSLSAEAAALLEQERAAQQAAEAAKAEDVVNASIQQAAGGNAGNAGNTDGGNTGYTPSPSPAPSYDEAIAGTVVGRAYSQIGKAYGYGDPSYGAGPNEYDCSGFVSFCLLGSYSRMGSTSTFMAWPTVSDPQPGDVCVNSGHCGIYIGNNQMIHAATYGVGVVIGPVQAGMKIVRP